jgi:hypothetical protein
MTVMPEQQKVDETAESISLLTDKKISKKLEQSSTALVKEEEKEEDEDLMSSHIIINLNGFLKDYTPNYEENPVDAIKACRENRS